MKMTINRKIVSKRIKISCSSPPLNGNYIPPLADLSFARLDDSIYRLTANKTSASVSHVETSNTPLSNTSVEIPRVESVRPSGVIIEDWVSDDKEDMFQSKDSQTIVKPSFKKIEFTKARNETVKTNKQAVKPRMVTQSPKVDRKDWNGKMTKKLRVSKEKVNTVRVNDVNTVGQTTVSTVKGNGVTAVKASAGCVWRPKMTDLNNGSKDNSGSWISKRGNLQQALKYKGMFDSGCSKHMTGNKALLTDYQDIDGGFVAFGGNTRGGKITGNQTNKNAQETNGNTGLKKNVDAGQTKEENVSTQQYIVFPLWSSISSSYKSSDDKAKDYTVDDDACRKIAHEPTKKSLKLSVTARKRLLELVVLTVLKLYSTPKTYRPLDHSSGNQHLLPFCDLLLLSSANLPHDPLMPELEDTAEIQSTGIFGNAYDDHDLETLNTPYTDQSVVA
ncbi:hypothetical protein Tco_0542415 [Tanacetum coccineum]